MPPRRRRSGAAAAPAAAATADAAPVAAPAPGAAPALANARMPGARFARGELIMAFDRNHMWSAKVLCVMPAPPAASSGGEGAAGGDAVDGDDGYIYFVHFQKWGKGWDRWMEARWLAHEGQEARRVYRLLTKTRVEKKKKQQNNKKKAGNGRGREKKAEDEGDGEEDGDGDGEEEEEEQVQQAEQQEPVADDPAAVATAAAAAAVAAAAVEEAAEQQEEQQKAREVSEREAMYLRAHSVIPHGERQLSLGLLQMPVNLCRVLAQDWKEIVENDKHCVVPVPPPLSVRAIFDDYVQFLHQRKQQRQQRLERQQQKQQRHQQNGATSSSSSSSSSSSTSSTENGTTNGHASSPSSSAAASAVSASSARKKRRTDSGLQNGDHGGEQRMEVDQMNGDAEIAEVGRDDTLHSERVTMFEMLPLLFDGALRPRLLYRAEQGQFRDLVREAAGDSPTPVVIAWSEKVGLPHLLRFIQELEALIPPIIAKKNAFAQFKPFIHEFLRYLQENVERYADVQYDYRQLDEEDEDNADGGFGNNGLPGDEAPAAP